MAEEEKRPSAEEEQRPPGEQTPRRGPYVVSGSKLGPEMLRTLSPEHLRALTPEAFRTLTLNQIEALTPEQVKALTPEQLGVMARRLFLMASKQLKTPTPEQLGVIVRLLFMAKLMIEPQTGGEAEDPIQVAADWQAAVDWLFEQVDREAEDPMEEAPPPPEQPQYVTQDQFRLGMAELRGESRDKSESYARTSQC